ncbi:hypothetical protein C1645_877215 [Glomus cerebriforme]|uniref:Uncharacterized protein n=1 Tax=Glomus cerebriforme TaxID=658196 RepID=A0A397SRR5_9GLOM|nr:hypothetical protein C1645_877215 [Glomus cerebriforme]
MTYTPLSSYTPNPDVLNMKELQIKMAQSIKHFSEIQKIKINDNDFIQEKVRQISDQRVKFRKFVEDSINHSLRMCTHADDLIIFAEHCEDDDISSEELLERLRTLLSNARQYKIKAELLKNVLNRVRVSLDVIVEEITKYNFNPERTDTTADKVTDEALSYAKGGLLTAGIGTMAAIAAAPFTAGTSLAVIPIAEAIVGLGALTILGGAATTTVSTVVAGGSSVVSGVQHYNLKREQFSRFLEMQKGLEKINEIITDFESHWGKQIVEIEDIIEKLNPSYRDGRRLVRTLARTISAKAKKIRIDSESYSVNIRQALNRNSISS